MKTRLSWRAFSMVPVALIAFAAFFFLLAPIVSIILASFEGTHSYRFRLWPSNPSLHWYTAIPPKFVRAFGVSAIVASLAALLSTLLGAMAALALAKSRIAGKAALVEFFKLPLQIPFVVIGVSFLQFYNFLSVKFDLDLVGSMVGLIAAHVFFTLPFPIASVLTVLGDQRGQTLEEAARIMGSDDWSVFRRVTLPVMKPGLFVGFFYAFIVSFGDVPATLFIGGGSGLRTLPIEIFDSLQFDFDPAILAVATLVVVFSAAMIVLVQRVVGVDLVMPSNRR